MFNSNMLVFILLHYLYSIDSDLNIFELSDETHRYPNDSCKLSFIMPSPEINLSEFIKVKVNWAHSNYFRNIVSLRSHDILYINAVESLQSLLSTKISIFMWNGYNNSGIKFSSEVSNEIKLYLDSIKKYYNHST